MIRLLMNALGRQTIIFAALSSLATSVLDLLGIALIFPYLKLATDDQFHFKFVGFLEDPYLRGLAGDHFTVLAVCGAALIGFFLIKALIHTLLIRYQAIVASRVNATLSREFVEFALGARFQLFLETGAVNIASVSYSNTAHAGLLLQHMLIACNEFIFIAAVVVATFLINPILSFISFGLIAGIVLLLFFPLSKWSARLGEETKELDIARHRFVFAMASAIRDIKIMGLEKMFSSRNGAITRQYAVVSADYATISSVLRLIVETLMLAAVVLGCIWLAYTGWNLVALAPTLATAGVVAARSGPAVSRLIGAYNGYKYSKPFVEHLAVLSEQIRNRSQKKRREPFSFAERYTARDITFDYGNKRVLHGINMDIGAGQVVALVGPSGSGKSTMLDVLSGLQPATSGRFFMDGSPFDPFGNELFSQAIGYVPQSITLLDGSLSFNVALEENPDQTRLQAAIKSAHLTELVQSLPAGVDTRIGDGAIGVSGGQRQRIGIARALYREPKILILDEITSALDEVTEKAVISELFQLRGAMALLFVTHRLSTLTAVDVVYEIAAGKLVSASRKGGGAVAYSGQNP